MTVLDTARAFKAVGERAIKKVPALRGKTVVNLFIEPSTRTRISFELAAIRLSADVINFTAEASSLKKGETLKDTARNLEALNADIIIIRHSATGAPHFLSRVFARQRRQRRRRRARASHAGVARHLHHSREEGQHRRAERHHPRRHSLQPRRPLEYLGALKLGAHVTLCGPSTLVPRVFEQMGCRVTYNVDEAIADADIINLLRIQHERQRQDDVSEHRRIHQPVWT